MNVSLLCIETPRDLVTIMNDKLVILENMFANPHTREDINRVRSAMSVFYGSLSLGALNRVRSSQINSLRAIVVPVSTLINEGLQLESGHLIPRKFGPNTARLGSYSTFGTDGTKSELPSILLVDAETGRLDNAKPPVIGENVFERAREMEMESEVQRQGCSRRIGGGEIGSSLSHVHLGDSLLAAREPPEDEFCF